MRHEVRAESWPIDGGFRIARGFKAVAEVVVVELHADEACGRGEAVPYARYGETVASVMEAIEATITQLGSALSTNALHHALPPGAARNALDCALWDLLARQSGKPVWERLGFKTDPGAIETMRTVSVADAQSMAEQARALAGARTLKVKVDGGTDLARVEAVHAAAPDARIVLDGNESWTAEQLEKWLPQLPALGVVLIEQPLRAGDDDALRSLRGTIPFCADESFHDRSSFGAIEGRYDVVNVKLDKSGGLTEAIETLRDAVERGYETMVGCMVCTSLGVAPALPLAARADWVDLDGPLLLAKDREGGVTDAARSTLSPSSDVWGP